jgi:hypothetical protein
LAKSVLEVLSTWPLKETFAPEAIDLTPPGVGATDIGLESAA